LFRQCIAVLVALRHHIVTQRALQTLKGEATSSVFQSLAYLVRLACSHAGSQSRHHYKLGPQAGELNQTSIAVSAFEVRSTPLHLSACYPLFFFLALLLLWPLYPYMHTRTHTHAYPYAHPRIGVPPDPDGVAHYRYGPVFCLVSTLSCRRTLRSLLSPCDRPLMCSPLGSFRKLVKVSATNKHLAYFDKLADFLDKHGSVKRPLCPPLLSD
jgi:hypothetical protein